MGKARTKQPVLTHKNVLIMNNMFLSEVGEDIL